MVGLSGLEPPTSRLSGVRSNLLSYSPISLLGKELLRCKCPYGPLTSEQYNQQPYMIRFRKEVIQPHLPIRLPCYDFTPVTSPALGSSLLAVGSLTSGVTDSHGVTGGVYKTRERIHRDMLIRDY